MSKDEVHRIMMMNSKPTYINPLHFDCPPPVYESSHDFGWTKIAKAIIAK